MSTDTDVRTSDEQTEQEQPEAAPATPERHVPVNPVRIVTAASLFDGHDAAINIMRRILQGMGAEVIHLGHNRSVEDVVRAALQEDADGFGPDAYGGVRAGFSARTEINRNEFGVDIKMPMDGGGVVVGDKISVELEIEAVLRAA